MSIETTVRIVSATCCACGHEIFMTDGFRRSRQDDHKFWHCLACGARQHWGQESNEERLSRQLRAAQQREETYREGLERERKVAQGYKGAWLKTKKRIGKGVCPCCNRRFENVERHMATKHPEYAGS